MLAAAPLRAVGVKGPRPPLFPKQVWTSPLQGMPRPDWHESHFFFSNQVKENQRVKNGGGGRQNPQAERMANLKYAFRFCKFVFFKTKGWKLTSDIVLLQKPSSQVGSGCSARLCARRESANLNGSLSRHMLFRLTRPEGSGWGSRKRKEKGRGGGWGEETWRIKEEPWEGGGGGKTERDGWGGGPFHFSTTGVHVSRKGTQTKVETHEASNQKEHYFFLVLCP